MTSKLDAFICKCTMTRNISAHNNISEADVACHTLSLRATLFDLCNIVRGVFHAAVRAAFRICTSGFSNVERTTVKTIIEGVGYDRAACCVIGEMAALVLLFSLLGIGRVLLLPHAASSSA